VAPWRQDKQTTTQLFNRHILIIHLLNQGVQPTLRDTTVAEQQCQAVLYQF